MSHAAYPEQTRLIVRACATLGLAFTDLDGGGGYLFRISNGAHAFVAGAGTVSPYPLNRATPYLIARDKAHANAVLAAARIPVIESRLFFVDTRRIGLRAPGREVADALAYLEAAGRPMFVKPNTGSGGDFAEIVAGPQAFADYLARLDPRHEAVLIQPVIAAREHRVFCLDGRAVFATCKADFALTGDGARPLSALLAEANLGLSGLGVSPTPERLLVEQGLDLSCVPAAGERVAIAGRRNLAAGGAADILTEPPAALADLALRASAALGLRIAGVDIFDRSAAGDFSDLVVVEVNGNPALSSLVQAGREDLAVAIWREVLTTFFAELDAAG